MIRQRSVALTIRIRPRYLLVTTPPRSAAANTGDVYNWLHVLVPASSCGCCRNARCSLLRPIAETSGRSGFSLHMGRSPPTLSIRSLGRNSIPTVGGQPGVQARTLLDPVGGSPNLGSQDCSGHMGSGEACRVESRMDGRLGESQRRLPGAAALQPERGRRLAERNGGNNRIGLGEVGA